MTTILTVFTLVNMIHVALFLVGALATMFVASGLLYGILLFSKKILDLVWLPLTAMPQVKDIPSAMAYPLYIEKTQPLFLGDNDVTMPSIRTIPVH